MITFQFDTAKWSRLMAEYVAMGQVSSAGAVTAASRIWLRGAVRLTVPSGPGAELNKTSAQKKLGESLVKRDSERLFVQWSDVRGKLKSKRLVDSVNEYLGPKLNFKAARSVFSSAGMHFLGIISKPRKQLRNGRTNKRGHIRKKRDRFLVVEDGAIQAYTDAQIKNVGFAKSGWKTSCDRLKVKLPAWVKRHNGSGFFRGERNGDKPFIEFGNQVDIANANGRDDAVMEYSQRFALRQFEKSIKVYFNELKKGNGAKLRAKIQADTFSAIEA